MSRVMMECSKSARRCWRFCRDDLKGEKSSPSSMGWERGMGGVGKGWNGVPETHNEGYTSKWDFSWNSHNRMGKEWGFYLKLCVCLQLIFFEYYEAG